MEPYQIYSLLEALIITCGVLGGMGIAGLVIVKRRKIPPASRSASPDLMAVVNELRDTVEGMREDVTDMADRLEFTERAMAQLADSKNRNRLPGG